MKTGTRKRDIEKRSFYVNVAYFKINYLRVQTNILFDLNNVFRFQYLFIFPLKKNNNLKL